MESDLRALLTGYAPLTALVSTRIAWNAIGQGWADPNVVLYKITSAPGYHMQGSDGLESSIVQINVRALTFASMIAVKSAIVARLSGYRGSMGDTEFQGIFKTGERQAFEKVDTTSYHTAQLDFEVHSRAAA
jgi:hypothetical protein